MSARSAATVWFFFSVLDRLLALFDQPHHPLARLWLGLFSEQFEGGFQPFNLPFCLLEVFLEGFLELWMVRGFGHLGQGCHELTFGMEKVLEFFDEQFSQHLI